MHCYCQVKPHPSDNIGAAVASAQYADRSGKELITGVGIAYEVHGEMAAKAPGRDIGWDHIHVTFGSVSAASKLMGLDYDQIRNAVGIATAAYNPLRVTRTGEISMWKGIASANLARNAVYTAMLAENGMEGPVDAFEGQKGWKEIVQERDFQVDFTPCERINEVMTKKYMAGTHAQTAIEGLIEAGRTRLDRSRSRRRDPYRDVRECEARDGRRRGRSTRAGKPRAGGSQHPVHARRGRTRRTVDERAIRTRAHPQR